MNRKIGDRVNVKSKFVHFHTEDPIDYVRIYRDWVEEKLDKVSEVVLIGITHKQTGQIKAHTDLDYHGNIIRQESYLEVKSTIKGYMAVPIANDGRYRKPIFVTEECIVEA